MTKSEIVAALKKVGTTTAKANQYADAFLQYQEATANIESNGVVVLHPRTANPIKNPYLEIRSNAIKMLRLLRGVDADFLWETNPAR